MAGSLRLQQFTAAQISQEQQRGVLILDTRPAEQFAAAHIRGAMQLGLMGPFASWAAILISPVQRLLIVAENETSVQEARTRLSRVGIEHIGGFALADEARWLHHGIRLGGLPIHRCGDICRNQQEGRKPQLIDVRSSAEWLKGHLPGAISLPLLEINLKAASIDFSSPSLVYCREGYHAATAASLLLRGNAQEVGILIDAMDCIDRPRACGMSCGTSWDGFEMSSLVHL
jgi:rhodanese-related sulfurtransferase